MGATDADFSGWATKAGLKCSDGRMIMKDAFAHQDQAEVSLVWQHSHNDPENVLGHAVLENRPEGVYAHAYFNDTPKGQHAKALVQHGDVKYLSIYANQLVEKTVDKTKQVMHGMIRELSLVIAGANPGAVIDQVRVAHGDGEVETLEDEAFITTGIQIEHSDLGSDDSSTDDEVSHADSAGDGKTIAEVLGTLTEEQQVAVNVVIGAALEAQAKELTSAQHSDESDSTTTAGTESAENSSEGTESTDQKSSEGTQSDDSTTSGGTESSDNEGDLAHQEGSDTNMTRNVFDQNGAAGSEGPTLSHSQMAEVIGDMKAHNGSFKDSLLAHAADYGIDDISLLFPDAKLLANSPELKSRRMEWVAKVLDNTKHTPFSKVKSLVFDITAEEARARGYVKGTKKVDEVIKLLRRTTGPTTIYKKQRLDRDDILDITDMDVVTFLKAEMRLMIEEEVARAILVGDGRSDLSNDKVKDPAGSIDGNGIRSIMHDDDLYSVKYPLPANVAPKDAVKGLVRARSQYRGSGKPTLFISDNWLTEIMLEEDRFGRPLYETEQSLADKLRVSELVTVDVFDDHPNLFAIMVNLADYSIGANRGGELTSFEQFDIDYNQEKYLQETRLSGGLVKPFSAVVVTREQGTLANAAAPSFDGPSNTITIPTSTGVVYQIDGNAVTGDVVITKDTTVEAVADEGYYLAPNTTRDWSYTYTA